MLQQLIWITTITIILQNEFGQPGIDLKPIQFSDCSCFLPYLTSLVMLVNTMLQMKRKSSLANLWKTLSSFMFFVDRINLTSLLSFKLFDLSHSPQATQFETL